MPYRIWLAIAIVATLNGCKSGNTDRRGDTALNTRRAQPAQAQPGTQGQDAATNEKLMEQRLLDARAAYVHRQYSEAIRIARSALGMPQQAWRVIGASACLLKDSQQAIEAWKNLDADGHILVELACSNNLITLPFPSSAPGGATYVSAITLMRQQVSHPDPHLPLEVRRAHPGEDLAGLYLVCLDEDGSVSSVKSLEPMARVDPAVDDGVMEQIRTRWRYQPQPVRVCFGSRIVFKIN